MQNGLMCFLNDTRECGADCMAYLTEPPEDGSKLLGAQQRNCVLIVSAERLGRYASGIVQLMLKSEADKKRSSQPTPPNPLGKA